MTTVRFAAAAAILLAAMPAQAQLLATASRANNYSNNTTGAWVTVPIKDALTTVNFATSAPNQTVRITYNAECGALGSPGSWLGIQILVDGLPTDPNSGTSFAMCTATSTTSYNWTGAVRQSTLLVPHSGTHKLTVQGYGVSTTTWWLGDTSIVVDK